MHICRNIVLEMIICGGDQNSPQFLKALLRKTDRTKQFKTHPYQRTKTPKKKKARDLSTAFIFLLPVLDTPESKRRAKTSLKGGKKHSSEARVIGFTKKEILNPNTERLVSCPPTSFFMNGNKRNKAKLINLLEEKTV